MSTRGAVGVRIDGQDKIMYNHSDSYPAYLGQHMIEAMRAVVTRGVQKYAKLAREFRVVSVDAVPTAEDIKKCKAAGVIDRDVGRNSEEDWYCLLREAQGQIIELRHAMKHMRPGRST